MRNKYNATSRAIKPARPSHTRLGLAALALLIVVATLLLPAHQARAQGSLEEVKQRMKEAVQKLVVPPTLLTDGPYVHKAFQEVVSGPSQWTVRVKCDGNDVSLGCIVDPDGWIITKASQLDGQITCHFKDGREFEARQTGYQAQYDLAMLKIDATGLPAAHWKDSQAAELGQWVATPGPSELPIAVGVVSAAARAIPKRSGILGIRLEDGDAGPRIIEVMPDSGAEIAGLLVNDEVTHVNDKQTHDSRELVLTVRKYGPGDTIQLTIRREEKTLKIKATLSHTVKGIRPSRRDIQDNMGGNLSERRHGFPSVLQHDTVLRPVDCGGAIVDLDGHVLGINVARAGRTESYAVPARIVLAMLDDLKSGRLPPPSSNIAADESQEVPAEEAPMVSEKAPASQPLREGQPPEPTPEAEEQPSSKLEGQPPEPKPESD